MKECICTWCRVLMPLGPCTMDLRGILVLLFVLCAIVSAQHADYKNVDQQVSDSVGPGHPPKDNGGTVKQSDDDTNSDVNETIGGSEDTANENDGDMNGPGNENIGDSDQEPETQQYPSIEETTDGDGEGDGNDTGNKNDGDMNGPDSENVEDAGPQSEMSQASPVSPKPRLSEGQAPAYQSSQGAVYNGFFRARTTKKPLTNQRDTHNKKKKHQKKKGCGKERHKKKKNGKKKKKNKNKKNKKKKKKNRKRC